MSRSGLAFRIGGSVLVAGILLALFLIGREVQPSTESSLPDPKETLAAIALLDRGIDAVLAGFDIVPVDVNAALNATAHRYRARAVASENLRLHSVTIHLELDGAVVHTVILKSITRRKPSGGRVPRVST